MDKKKLVIVAIAVMVVLVGVVFAIFSRSSEFSAPTPYFPNQNESTGTFADTTISQPAPTPTPVVTPAPETATKIEPPYRIEPADPQEVPDDEVKEDETESQPQQGTEISKDRSNKIFDEIVEAKVVTDEQLIIYLYGEEFLKNGSELPSRSKLIEELMLRLNSVDEYLANEAAIVLGKAVNEIDAQSLAEAIQAGGYSDFAEISLVRIIGKLNDRRVFKTLYDEFKRVTNERIRDAIIIAFGELGDERAISILLSVINATGKDLRQFYSPDSKALALAALVKIGTPRAKGAFETGLSEIVSSNILKSIEFTKARFDNQIDKNQIDTMIVPGQGQQELLYKGTRYWLYVPTKRKNDFKRTRVLVCVHSEAFDIDGMFSICRNVAKKYKFAVLAPIFEVVDYPFYGTFNLTGERADLRLWEILKHLSQYAALDIREIFLYGEGRGGVFVQSFSLAYADRVGRALFDSNTMIKPSKNEVFPNGTGPTPWAPDIKIDVEKFIKSDIALAGPRGQIRTRASTKVLKEYLKIADQNGVTPRIGIREYKADIGGDKRPGMQELIESYLFEGL